MTYVPITYRRPRLVVHLGDGPQQVPPAVTEAVLARLASEHSGQLKAALDAQVARMSEEMAKEISRVAAIQSSVTLAMSAVPVAGWAASAIAGAIQAISGSTYQREAEEIMADAKNQVDLLVAAGQKKIDSARVAAVNQEKQGAIDLILKGGTGPVQGPFSNFVDTLRSFGRSFDEHVIRPIAQPIRSYVGGRIVKEEAIKARDDIVFTARGKVDKYVADSITTINSPNYRAALRIELAKALVEVPEIQQILTSSPGIQADTYNQISMPEQTTAQRLALPIAAGAALIIGLALQ